MDAKGSVFSASGAGPGIIRTTSPEGRFLGSINLPIYGGEPKKQICATNEAFTCDPDAPLQLQPAGDGRFERVQMSVRPSACCSW